MPEAPTNTGSPRIRPAIASLPAYVPGARSDGRPMWKLSSNENPNAPVAEVLAAIGGATPSVNRYPDMYARDLTEALAARHGVDEASVVTGNGSVAVLGHVLSVFVETGDEVIVPWRSFEAYPIAIGVAGGTPVLVPNRPDGSHDLAALAGAVTDRTRVILLCSPNNPTSTALRDDEVREFLSQVPGDVVVVLDEAYRHYARLDGLVDGTALLQDFPNLIVLQTFSKAYGLAGIRVGYAVGAPESIGRVRAASTPFGTNTLAQAAALEALRHEPEVLDQVEATVAERARVVSAARAAGFDVPDAQGNFFWLPVGESAGRLVADADAAGLLVRGFQGEGVRITIGEPEANDAVIEFLRTWTR